MRLVLDGTDWEADYFLSDEEAGLRQLPGNIDCMNLRDAGGSGFYDASHPVSFRGTVPGDDRTMLLENGVISDPYFGRNLEHSSWSSKRSWGFRKRFVVPAEWSGCRVRLDCLGLDYQCRVFVNGVHLGMHVGMFIPESYDVTEAVRFGEENLLVVVFKAAPDGSANHFRTRPADFAQFHRVQLGFGWDWARKVVPTGIWDSVVLSAYRAVRVSDWHCRWDGRRLAVETVIEARADGVQRLGVRLAPSGFAGEAVEARGERRLVAGHNTVAWELEVPSPRLWYPVGYGEQPLYELTLEADGEGETHLVGLKTLEMRRNPDSPEGAYPQTFAINGTAVFARGMNWVPLDLLPSRCDAAGYDYFVRLAAAGGINLFRVWGGGFLEKEAFYEACDRYGVLVWQEFPLACSDSPKDTGYLAFKRREGTAALLRMRRHVSMAMVCGGNEMQYYGERPEAAVLEQYGELVKELAPWLPYHLSSPDLGRPGEHDHGPWHWLEHSFWNRHFRLLASEVGCNGMPAYESLRKFIPEAELEAGDGPSLDWHFCVRSGAKSLEIPVQEFQWKTMEQFCQASMLAQADALQYIMEHYRRLFPRASGCFVWQYNECWPTCAWNVVDYYGRPKQAYYALKRACQPVLLSLEDDSWRCRDGRLQARWMLTADAAVSGTARLAVWTVGGRKLFERTVAGEWAAGTVELAAVDEAVPSGELLVAFLDLDGAHRNFRVYGSPDFSPAFALPRTRLETRLEDGRVTVTNAGEAVAFLAHFDFPQRSPKEYMLEDDYLLLAPGESRAVGAAGVKAGERLVVKAWNA